MTENERKLVDTVSFRTQAFFRQMMKKFAEFLFKTKYSVLSRTVFEVGTLDLLANLAKLTFLERKILLQNSIFDSVNPQIMFHVLDTLDIFSSVFAKISQLTDSKMKNKHSISELWKIMYDNMEKILDFVLARFSEELILVFESDNESLYISEKMRRKISKKLPFKDEDIVILEKILWNGDIDSSIIFRKIVNFSSVESLKLWLWVQVALLIKLIILLEHKRRSSDIKAFKMLLYSVQNSLKKWLKDTEKEIKLM